MTPVHDGRFEVYLNGEKLYDRKEAGDKDFYPSLAGLRDLRGDILRKIEEPVPAKK